VHDEPGGRDWVTGDVLDGCGQDLLRCWLHAAGPEFCQVQFPEFVAALACGSATGGLECLSARLVGLLLPFSYLTETRWLSTGLGHPLPGQVSARAVARRPPELERDEPAARAAKRTGVVTRALAKSGAEFQAQPSRVESAAAHAHKMRALSVRITRACQGLRDLIGLRRI